LNKIKNTKRANMKKILFIILAAAAELVGNYFFSNSTFEVSVETPTPTTVPVMRR